MQKIADSEEYKMPATIDDPTILDEIETALKGIEIALGVESGSLLRIPPNADGSTPTAAEIGADAARPQPGGRRSKGLERNLRARRSAFDAARAGGCAGRVHGRG